MALKWPNKDPDDLLDYQIDWSRRLNTDTITASSWIVPADLTATNESHRARTTTVWLAGGILGTTYTIVNRVTTALGRIIDQSVTLTIETN